MPVRRVVIVRFDENTFTVRFPRAPEKGEIVIKPKPGEVDVASG